MAVHIRHSLVVPKRDQRGDNGIYRASADLVRSSGRAKHGASLSSFDFSLSPAFPLVDFHGVLLLTRRAFRHFRPLPLLRSLDAFPGFPGLSNNLRVKVDGNFILVNCVSAPPKKKESKTRSVDLLRSE